MMPQTETRCAEVYAGPRRVFLLSPANASGIRARMILSEKAGFDRAKRLRCEGLPLGEIFSFISGLYFRGKLAYAQAFAQPPIGVPGALIITSGRGLVPPETIVTLAELREMAEVPVTPEDWRYRGPLEQHARGLLERAGESCEVVLLGSIATRKYVEPLLEIFGECLAFPSEFVGRGDMSRGGLMLRCARELKELRYEGIAGANLHGRRPPKLPKIKVRKKKYAREGICFVKRARLKLRSLLPSLGPGDTREFLRGASKVNARDASSAAGCSCKSDSASLLLFGVGIH